MFPWLVPSLSARRGEVLRGVARMGALRHNVNLLFTPGSVAAFALNARESPDGDSGEFGDLGDFVNSWKRCGFEGDRDSDLRSCFNA